QLLLCSDEIHCDLILDPALKHISTATLSPEIAARTFTFMAPSKTYNLPGLGTSLAIISDPTLRTRFVRATAGIVAEVNTFGYTACEAAYRDSEDWRQALLTYLRGNRDFLLDFIALNLPNPTAHFEKHGVGLSDGFPFGAPKGHYVRINFGCPRSTLAEGLRRMKAAVGARQGQPNSGSH